MGCTWRTTHCRDFLLAEVDIRLIIEILAVHCTTAVNYLSAYICRKVRAEEHRNICHILRRTTTTHRNLLCPLILNLLRQLVCHLRDDEAWCDAVSADATRTHLLCDRLRKTNHTSLRCRVGTLASGAANTYYRRHIDD